MSGWRYKGEVLCDIEIKLKLGASVGAAGGLCCLFARLAGILTNDPGARLGGNSAKKEKMEGWTEWVVMLGLPVVLMSLQYLYQTGRYYVVGSGNGCYADLWAGWMTLLLEDLMPVVLCAVAAGSAGMCSDPTPWCLMPPYLCLFLSY